MTFFTFLTVDAVISYYRNVFSRKLTRCGVCRLHLIYFLLKLFFKPISQVPDGLTVVGQGRMVQARVCRSRRKCNDEAAAVVVSEALPFIM